MPTALLRRPAASDPSRVEVCPPLRASVSMWGDLALRVRALATRQGDRLARVRDEFCQTIADIGGPDAEDLIIRMRDARSLHELWYLRADVFNLVSLYHRQDEANRRLARLNRHFPCRASRSAFAPLSP